MARLFGTDGVRGIANDSLTPELAYHLGRAAAYIFGQNKEHPTFLIGRDTRRSGTMLASILAAGIASAGGECYMVGVIPTPAVAYLTRTHHMDAGVVISASHNPFEYNGIKFFDGYGYKLPDEMEDRIEEYMLRDERAGLQSRPVGAGIGTISLWTDLQQEYADFVCKSTNVDLSGLKVVYDGANGAAYSIGPEILKRLGAEVIAIHTEPNGVNINDNCGSTHLEDLKETVLRCGADIGIANDGDADRCLAVDEKGQEMDGDQTEEACLAEQQAPAPQEETTLPDPDGDDDTGLERRLLAEAGRGNAEAQYQLGLFYAANGDLQGDRSVAKCAFWMRKAAERGIDFAAERVDWGLLTHETEKALAAGCRASLARRRMMDWSLSLQKAWKALS